jgi:hypothetical protein
MAHIIRPKDTTRDDERGMVGVEEVYGIDRHENQYLEAHGFDPTVSGISGSAHYKGRGRVPGEAPVGSPLPGGNWRG